MKFKDEYYIIKSMKEPDDDKQTSQQTNKQGEIIYTKPSK